MEVLTTPSFFCCFVYCWRLHRKQDQESWRGWESRESHPEHEVKPGDLGIAHFGCICKAMWCEKDLIGSKRKSLWVDPGANKQDLHPTLVREQRHALFDERDLQNSRIHRKTPIPQLPCPPRPPCLSLSFSASPFFIRNYHLISRLLGYCLISSRPCAQGSLNG